jgi:AcrR family transcriptional regulator
MSRIATNDGEPSTRAHPYQSPLRARHVEDTRTAILEAAVRVAARGIAALSVPEVAREAGVSVPTVYRHFRTKQDLIDAMYPYLEQRAGLAALAVPGHIDDLRAGVRRLLDHIDAFDDLARAAMASRVAEEGRHRSMPRRLALVGAMVDTIDPPLPPEERDRIVRLVVILTSSQSLRTWQDHLGISPDAVVDDIDATVRAAIAAARERRR